MVAPKPQSKICITGDGGREEVEVVADVPSAENYTENRKQKKGGHTRKRNAWYYVNIQHLPVPVKQVRPGQVL